MGNLAEDTKVIATGQPNRYTARLSPDWAIWGPNGGYLATVALRAMAASTALPRPISFSCHYLSVASFDDDVDLSVRTMRATRRVASLAVSVSQGGTPVMEATAWFGAGGGEGIAHDHELIPSEVPHWSGLPAIQALLPPDATPMFPFWSNLECRPVKWIGNWAERVAGEPLYREWYRYRPVPTFEEPAVDAGRLLVLLDTLSWPAAVRAHGPEVNGWIAPSLDVNVQFHRLAPASEWLLAEGWSGVATEGIVGFRSRVWSDGGPRPGADANADACGGGGAGGGGAGGGGGGGRLLGSGSGQLLCRPAPPPRP